MTHFRNGYLISGASIIGTLEMDRRSDFAIYAITVLVLYTVCKALYILLALQFYSDKC